MIIFANVAVNFVEYYFSEINKQQINDINKSNM